MSVGPSGILAVLAIGIGATLGMDLWNLFLRRAFGVPSLDYCLLGRWVLHIPGRGLRHANIRATPPKPHECAAGWATHYTIGIALAAGLVALTSGEWLVRPTFPTALLYGSGTVVFPFFLLQPSLGLGVASSRTPHPTRARLKSLATHTIFGIGLYLCSVGVSRLLARG